MRNQSGLSRSSGHVKGHLIGGYVTRNKARKIRRMARQNNQSVSQFIRSLLDRELAK